VRIAYSKDRSRLQLTIPCSSGSSDAERSNPEVDIENPEEEGSIDEASSGSEDEEQPPQKKRAYNALLELLNSATDPKPSAHKKRKLSHREENKDGENAVPTEAEGQGLDLDEDSLQDEEGSAGDVDEELGDEEADDIEDEEDGKRSFHTV
jgi:hypothetical protein